MIAADIMTPNPKTMQPTASVSQAVETLQSMHVRHLPIVDERGHLIGMLSDRDLGALMRTFAEDAEAERMIVPLSQRRIGDVMSADVLAVEGDADVVEVIQLMLDERVGAVPVIDGAGHVQGIVSYVDVLRALAIVTETTERATTG
jgi:acetoin utilization protein AcuB